MKLLDRVSALIRANINDLLDRAEDPEKMIKQLITDMNNQLIQVKTTVAQALADQHMLERRLTRSREEAEAMGNRAELAVDKGDDMLARAALERMNSLQRTIEDLENHLEIQKKEVDDLKMALTQLDTRIAEVTRSRDLLLARHRRAVAKDKLTKVNGEIHPEKLEELLDALAGYVDKAETRAQASEELHTEHTHRRLVRIEAEDKLDKQLNELKERRKTSSAA